MIGQVLENQIDFDIKSYTFDGDTPADARQAIRSAGHIVVTNPDMLHTGILPHHTTWVKLFENLHYIVIDEIHQYRGVLGSHLANVLRRLKRICLFYGSRPQFICCSATIANPLELAEHLTGEKHCLVNRNGAPRGEKHFILYNPPVVNRELGIRRSSVKDANDIAAKFVRQGIQTIVFARSRCGSKFWLPISKRLCPGPTIRILDSRLSRRLFALQRREIERATARRYPFLALSAPMPSNSASISASCKSQSWQLSGFDRQQLAASLARRPQVRYFPCHSGRIQFHRLINISCSIPIICSAAIPNRNHRSRQPDTCSAI
jgi:ATP-dependent helicase YprA (DUF1998 family)